MFVSGEMEVESFCCLLCTHSGLALDPQPILVLVALSTGRPTNQCAKTIPPPQLKIPHLINVIIVIKMVTTEYCWGSKSENDHA